MAVRRSGPAHSISARGAVSLAMRRDSISTRFA